MNFNKITLNVYIDLAVPIDIETINKYFAGKIKPINAICNFNLYIKLTGAKFAHRPYLLATCKLCEGLFYFDNTVDYCNCCSGLSTQDQTLLGYVDVCRVCAKEYDLARVCSKHIFGTILKMKNNRFNTSDIYTNHKFDKSKIFGCELCSSRVCKCDSCSRVEIIIKAHGISRTYKFSDYEKVCLECYSELWGINIDEYFSTNDSFVIRLKSVQRALSYDICWLCKVASDRVKRCELPECNNKCLFMICDDCKLQQQEKNE